MENPKPEIDEVKIISILSPSQISVFLHPNLSPSLLHSFEDELESEFNRNSRLSTSNLFTVSQDVIYKEELKINGGAVIVRYVRGHIVSKSSKVIRLFLLDHGEYREIDSAESLNVLSELNKDLNGSLAPYSSIVILPGIGPSSNLKLPSGDITTIKGNRWSKEAHDFVVNWFEPDTIAMTRFKSISSFSVYGDFYKENSSSSLSFDLLNAQLAYFDKKVFDLSISNPS